jgi:hypothetical protein
MMDGWVLVPVEYCAIIPGDVLCPMCEGKAFVSMEGWKNKKPCPICRGVGQMKENLIPSRQIMIQKMMAITPPEDREKIYEALMQQ